MPDDGLKKKYVQIGDGPQADAEKIHERIRLLIRVLRAVDGKKPSLESGVAVATLKTLMEDWLGRVIDVHMTHGGDPEKIRKELQERYEREGKIAPTGSYPANTTFH